MKTINSLSSKLLALTLALIASVSIQAHDFSVDGIYYNFLDDNNVEVTFKGYTNYDEEYFNDIVIPQSVTYNDVTYMVTAIGREAFAECSQLTSVTFGNHVKSIGSSAFRECTTLTCVTMPIGLEQIGSSAFDNCTSLASITIPNSVMTIELGAFSSTAYYNDAKNWEEGVLYISNCLIEAKTSIAGDYSIKPGTRLVADYALFGCNNLTSVTFAQSVKSIGDASFYECKNMKVVNMSDSLHNIGDRAFAHCELLNPVTIPVGVKTFGEEVFMGCKSLVSVIWNAKECQNFPYFYMAPFYRISSKITSITFGDEVEYIPAGMCYGLSAVPSVTIPVNVKRIGKDAFESCTSMTSITWNAKHYCNTLDYPPFEGLEYIVKSFTFGEGIETIPPYICKEMREVSEIIIPKGVKGIGRHAFNYCLSIPSIIIPEGVTTIGSAAFFHTQIRSVTVPEGVTEIGGWAFSECYGLNKIELPSTLNSIGNSAFKETYHIDTLICRAVLPPTMGELPVFEGVKQANISLFVPKESIELYKKAEQWKEFGQILPIEPTSYKSQWCDTWNVLDLKYRTIKYTTKEDFETWRYYLAQDTIINNYTYTAVTRQTTKVPEGVYPFTIPEPEYVAAVRFTEDSKVYIYYDNTEYLLYDFNVQSGDELTVFAGINHYHSHHTNTIRVDEVERYPGIYPFGTEISLSVFPDFYGDVRPTCYGVTKWVEGVGDLCGFITGADCGLSEYQTALLCAYKDGNTEYTTEYEEYAEYGCEYNSGENKEYILTLPGLQRTVCNEYCGDTEDDNSANFTYKQTFDSIFFENDKPYILCNGYLLREEDNKIFLYSQSLNKDIVLYDFTLEVGDSLPAYIKDFDGTMYSDDTLVVTDISSVTLLDGKEYKKWTFDNGMEYVEGIGMYGGHRNGNFFGLIQEIVVPCHTGTHLVCVSKNNQLLYQMDDAEMERLGAECLCDYDRGPRKDNAKNGKIGGRPTPTQWNMLEVETKEMNGTPIVLRAETFSYTLENDSTIANGKTFYHLGRQSTKDTATTKSFVGALHFGEDEDNRVYFLRDGVEYVLYDFTAEPGDTIEIFAGINNYPQHTTYTHVVTGKDTIENGACRMMLEVVFPEENASVENAQKVWLAGLGSIDGIVHNAAAQTNNAQAAPSRSVGSSETQTSVMLCAWREDSCLYTTNHPEYDTFGCVYNQDPTAIESPTSPSSYQKFLREGQLLIMHDGKIYTIMGIEIK